MSSGLEKAMKYLLDTHVFLWMAAEPEKLSVNAEECIMNAELYKKIREVMVAYVIEKNCGKLLTIHPSKERQKRNRMESGRWRKI